MTRARAYLVLALALAAVRPAAGQGQPAPFAALTVPATVFIVTDDKATGLYHRKDCPWLHGTAMKVLMLEEAKKRYFQAHCLCIAGKEGVPPCDSPVTVDAASVPAQAATIPTAPAANSVVAIPRTAPVERSAARQQCAATTKKGTRCSRMAQPGRAYCYQHP